MNSSGKNWFFWKTVWGRIIILDTLELITIEFRIRNLSFSSKWCMLDVNIWKYYIDERNWKI